MIVIPRCLTLSLKGMLRNVSFKEDLIESMSHLFIFRFKPGALETVLMISIEIFIPDLFL